MSLRAEVLSPGTRARGMGIFFKIFYAGAVAVPVAAGWMADGVGSSSATFIFGASMLLVAAALLAVFRRSRGQMPAFGSRGAPR